jgi:ABC-type dipeptide/oligopeptide/nickel transport system permease component
MLRYFLNKILLSIILIFGILTLVFFMLRVTGDPASLMMPREASPQQIEAFRESMGFNRPLGVQYVDFLSKAVVGNFGNSLHYNTPALPLVVDRLPATVELAIVGLLMALFIGVPLGLVAGFNPGSLIDSFGRLIGLLGQSIPNFWLALILILTFAVRLGWFPTFGRDEPKSVILPAFVLGLAVTSQILRMTRSTVLEVRSEDYIRTARSKGLSSHTIYFKHVLRNVSIPLVSLIGVQFCYMLSGSIYIETIYAWPGMGRLLQESIGWRDFPLVQALAVFTSVVVIILNLGTDLAYALIDPRIRYGK